jgi:hypothetical protein
MASDPDAFRPLLLLALHAGNRASCRATDLSNNRFLLVFGQVFGGLRFKMFALVQKCEGD